MKILLYEPLLRFDSLLPAHGLATKGKASGIKPRKTRNQKKALYNRRPPTCIHQHSSPAPRHPPNPLHCRVMADTTPCSSSAVPYTSTLPPLPTPPYRPHSLVNYINDFTLLDPTDLSSGAPSSSTAVESGNVTAWNFRSIRFSLDDTMLERLENRLRWLRLDEHRPQTLGVPISVFPMIMTEDDVRIHLNEIFLMVNSIIRNDDLVHQDPNPSRGGDGRRAFPIWRGQFDGSGRPDYRLYERKFDPDEFVKLHRGRLQHASTP